MVTIAQTVEDPSGSIPSDDMVVWLEGNFWSTIKLSGVALIAGLVIGYFVWRSSPSDIVSIGIPLLVMFLFLIVLAVFLLGLRAVGLEDHYILLRFGYGTEKVAWSALQFSSPAETELTLVRLFDSLNFRYPSKWYKGKVKGVNLPLGTARAVLAHPSCPRWDLPSTFKAKLKLK